MTSTQAPGPGAWPAVADAGHLLISALHQEIPPAGIQPAARAAGRPAPRGDMLPPQHKPLELTLLARTLDGLRALSTERGSDAAARQPAGTPRAEVREADLDVWPLFAGLGPLGALPTAPRLVRSFGALVLSVWGLAAFGDDTELLLSELATNAVAAATGPDGRPRYDGSGRLHLLWARLLSDRSRLRLEVWDTIPEDIGVPVQRQAAPDDESGRGLELLDLLSATWGWEPVPGRAAKKVWAECALEAPDCIPGSAGRNLEDIPGSMAYLASKGKGDRSMPLKRRPGPGIRDGAPQDPRNMSES